MTSPEDDDLEQALRQALSAAADKVEPGADGLDQIRARIDGRPPRPWLLSVVYGVLDRARHWTWHGHWAWQESLPGLGTLWGRRSRRSNFPHWEIRWLRLVTILAGVAVLAAVALGVQPFRQAILQASTSLNGGGGGPTRGSAGTEGSGTQAGGGAASGGASSASGQPGPGSSATVTRKSQTAAPSPTSTVRCVATTLPVAASARPSPTIVAADASATAPAIADTTPAASSPASPTPPNYTNTDVPTCPVTPPTGTPTPTPSASSSPAPTPTDVSPSPDPVPSDTAPVADPTPTPAPSESDPAWPGPPHRPPYRGHKESRDSHPRQR